MDFKSLVNKESFKAILQHHLKNQVRSKFGNSVAKDIQRHTESEFAFPDSVASSVSNGISQSEEHKEFLKTFLNNLNNLFEDKEKYVPKEENQGKISQCSSASSVNTSSIDYISFDQFQDLISILNTGINAEKLEALETFSRLPSLEHIMKQSLWPSVENGLHNALTSNVTFLKEASIKVYIKMLSSSESKVVQESFSSLIKHILQNLLSPVNENNENFINKCKSVVEIIAILNKFLQNISNHWLRYPQHVIENITVQSVSILSYGSKTSNIFPIWLCIALCDKKSKWLKNILHGHVSRTFLFDTLQKDNYIIKYIVQFCKDFDSGDNCKSLIHPCCQKFAEISEITHIICFVSHLMQYSQGRKLFNLCTEEESFTWLNVMDLIMKCTYKLCQISCLNCCAVLWDVVCKLWSYIWSSDNKCSDSDYILKSLLHFHDVDASSINSLSFITQCICNAFPHIFYICSEETQNLLLNFIYKLLQYLTNVPFLFPEISSEELMLLNTGLLLVEIVLSYPSNLLVKFSFIKLLLDWCLKISNISKIFASSYSPGLKNHLVLETEKQFVDMFISLLKKPGYFIVSHNYENFEANLNILLEKILDDIKFKKSVCPHDISVLSLALNSTYLPTTTLNKSITFKLSSIIWQLETGDLENLSKVKFILQILIPSIFPDIFDSEILLDVTTDNDTKLFQFILLFPSLTKQEFVMFEEYNILALEILSLLTSSVLSSCYLQAKYKLSDLLFDLQSYHKNENDIFIIGPLSVLQNHILVKLYAVGGSVERVLPPETLLENDESYEWPFFMNYPVPDDYYQNLSFSNATKSNVSSLELTTDNLKDIFLEYVECDLLSIDIVSQMLRISIENLEEKPDLSRMLNFVTLNDMHHIDLQDETVVGIQMMKRYGSVLNQISIEYDEDMEKLFQAGKYLFGFEHRSQFDLFISTSCLIFKCDTQASWLFLEAFSKSICSFFIWHERILQAINQDEKFLILSNIIMQHCDIIVKKMLPHVYSALQFTGISPSDLFKYWTMHCYWNYLNFMEIAHFIVVSVIFGGDFAIYFFVSVLKHIQSVILKNAHNFNMTSLLKQSPIKNYKICEYIDFIFELSDIFHENITKSILDVLEE